MKRILVLSVLILSVLTVLSSCVSTPLADSAMAPASPAVPEQAETQPAVAPPVLETSSVPKTPVLKERSEEYRVPVLVKETRAFADGFIDQVTEYEWSAGYARLLSASTRKPSSVDPVERSSYEYIGELLTARSTFGSDGALQNRVTFAYDPQGRLIKETLADGKGVVQSVSEWIWEADRKAEWKVLDSKGMVLARTEYRYQDEVLTEIRMSDGAGNLNGRGEYAYDKSGGLTDIRYFSATGAARDRMEFRLENGLVVQENYFRADGRLERGVVYENGPEGQVLKKTLTDASGKPRESISFEYAIRIETRTVSYYE